MRVMNKVLKIAHLISAWLPTVFPRGSQGCLPFVRIIRLGRALINGKDFPKSPNQPNEMALTICNRPFYSCVLSYLAMNASEVGVELALIQTSLFFSCK